MTKTKDPQGGTHAMKIAYLVILTMDLLMPFLIAIPYRDFKHTKQVMSVLGCPKSPLAIFYNVWMILSGIAVCAMGISLNAELGGGHRAAGISMMVLLIAYGAGDEILSGFFPLDDSVRTDSRASQIHGVGSVIGFICLLFAPIPLAFLAFHHAMSVLGVLTIVCFLLALISFVSFVMGDKPRFAHTVLGLTGLWQRLICLFTYLPFIATLIL